MDNTVSIIVSALASGILATIITLFWQSYIQKKRTENDIFRVLMSYRFRIVEFENVKAINSIQVIFSKNKAIQQAWKNFMEKANKIPPDDQGVQDAYIKLLEVIGQACGYREIKWDEIKTIYCPIALSNEILENEQLREINLQRAERDLNNQPTNNGLYFQRFN